jgi:tetraacyldisaccharide 4'-kinase
MNRRPYWVGAALTPLALAYGAAVRIREAWYARGGSARRAPLPVISVGNLAVGGTGKTPLVAWLARRLQAEGRNPAVVSRGYGGTAGAGPLVVSTGGGPRVNARTCGDEPHALARALSGVIVVVGADRLEGARRAAAAGADTVILDDGFQHRSLARDLDIVVLDGRAPFDGGSLLPKGRLRERPQALRRAQAVVLTRLRANDPAQAAIDAVRRAGFTGVIARGGHQPTGFRDAKGMERAAPPRAFAFCGIGDPKLFRADLEAAGVVLVGFRAFRDHHPYTAAEWDALASRSLAMSVPLVTTEKDLSRVEPAAGASLGRARLLVMGIETVVWDEAPLLRAVRGALLTPR